MQQVSRPEQELLAGVGGTHLVEQPSLSVWSYHFNVCICICCVSVARAAQGEGGRVRQGRRTLPRGTVQYILAVSLLSVGPDHVHFTLLHFTSLGVEAVLRSLGSHGVQTRLLSAQVQTMC